MYHRSKCPVFLDARPLVTTQFDKIKFKVITPNIKKAFKSPNYLGAQLWDKLPLDVQLSAACGIFKTEVKSHIAAGLFD